ncbi:MAG: KUP/HAK/KT family potassium transporter [Opitutae bacterium]
MKEANPEATAKPTSSTPIQRITLASTIAALGVVFGDIGTSPLYAFRECIRNGLHEGATPEQVIVPALSLIIWSLILVVTVKYVLFMMDANDDGEGGIMTLVSLASKNSDQEKIKPGTDNPTSKPKHRNILILLGVFGTALLFGDGVITPAISVLSALEGVKEQTTSSSGLIRYFIPVTAVIILIGIFALQKRGSGKVGMYFGPITLVWFAVIAATGVNSLYQYHKESLLVYEAFKPMVAIDFMVNSPGIGIVVLGAVFLAVTGAEALYADMGHFGEKPIRAGWYFIVFPALILNYLGQGAWAIANQSHILSGSYNPFYNMAPAWSQIPLVVIATLAAIIASQALIAGAFSTTVQAIQLNFLPRMRISYTSDQESGQIYMPVVNWLLLAGSVFLVLQYRSSENLASAYGISVSGTMLVTTILYAQYLHKIKKFPVATSYIIVSPILMMEILFISGNATKIFENGWLPLAIGFVLYYIMSVWNKGRIAMRTKLAEAEKNDDFKFFIESVEERFKVGKLSRVKGTAVYLSGGNNSVPMALAHNLKHNKVLHDHIIVITLTVDDSRAFVRNEERVSITTHGHGFVLVGNRNEFPPVMRITGKFGFREKQDIYPILDAAYKELGIEPNPMEVTYFLSRETIVRAEKNISLNTVQEKLFEVLNRNALSATAYFNLPPGRVVELGMQVEL